MVRSPRLASPLHLQSPRGVRHPPPEPQVVPTVVVSLEAVQSERIRADLAESLLQGTQEALQSKLNETYQTLRAEQLRAEIAETTLAVVRQEADQLKEVSHVHAEVAAEATRRAEASDAERRILQVQLDTTRGSSVGSGIGVGSTRSSCVVEQCRPRVAQRSISDSSYDHEQAMQAMLSRNRTRSESLMDNDSSSSPRYANRSLAARELLSMVQASAEEVLQCQVDLGLEKQANSRLQKRMEQIEIERNRLLSDAADVEQMRAKEKDLRALAQDSIKEAERLRQELNSSRKASADLSKALQSAVADRDGLARDLAEVTQSCAELRESDAENRKKAQAAEQEVRMLRAETARVRSMVEAGQREVANVREELAAKNGKIEALSNDKHMIDAEYKTYKEYHGTGDQHQLKAIAKLEFTVAQLLRQHEATKTELVGQQTNTEQMRSYVQSLEEQNKVLETQRRELHNTVQELKGNIRVYCRVRPQFTKEETSLHVADGSNLNLIHADEHYNFSFDKVFGVDALQAEIFDEVDGLVQSALDGYKVCIFAYGQTGSGKTYTMEGTDKPGCWGLIPRSLSKIFDVSRQMRVQGWSWSLQVSVLEIYNENVRDLLQGGGDNAAGPATGHTIQHDDAWGTVVTNLTCFEVTSIEQITALMARAGKQRSVGATDMNTVSSRSHCVFALYLKGTNSSLGEEYYGALHLVDLSGSERLDKSNAAGDRLRETQSINKSLSSLTDVFVAKAEGRAHVPFRNSKLTYLLEPCLSGQGKTLMLVNVRAEQNNSHETLCSLRFARQVNQCDTGGKPKRTVKTTIPGFAVQSRVHRDSITTAASSGTGAKTPRGRQRAQSREGCVTPIMSDRQRSSRQGAVIRAR